MNHPYKKILAYFLGLTTLSSSSFVAWEYGWLTLATDYFIAAEAPALAIENGNSIEDLSWEDLPSERTSPERDDELPGDEEIWEEEEFRTSDMEETYYRRTGKEPPNEPRFGCICMDSKRQDKKGAGACSGHGGVRFWLYQEPNGEITEYPTRRHKKHPAKLNAAELATLGHYKEQKLEYGAKKEGSKEGIAPYVAVVMMLCMTVIYIANLKWGGQDK